MKKMKWDRQFVLGIIVFVLVISSVQLPVQATESEENFIISVGLIDITGGMNQFSGHIEPISDQDSFQKKLYLNGRVAFYLQGKIKGKYLITAQLDTGYGDLVEIFKRLGQQPVNSAQEPFKPEEYYPVYGDDSNASRETNGENLYIKVEWDRSRFLWANGQKGVETVALAAFKRNLYGAQLDYHSPFVNAEGKSRTEVHIFGAAVGTVHSRDEMVLGDYSVFYFKHARILRNSEIVKIEVRDQLTSQVVKSIELQAGRDYVLDPYQGQLILLRSAPELLGTELVLAEMESKEAYLVSEYEFIPEGERLKNASYGLAFRQYLQENISLSASFINDQNQDGEDYRLYGIGLIYHLPNESFIRGEWAGSNNQPATIHLSPNNGLTYNQLSAADQMTGTGWKVDASLNWPENWEKIRDGKVIGYYASSQEGFTTTNQRVQTDQRQYGLKATADFSEDVSFVLDYQADEKIATSINKQILAQLIQREKGAQLLREIKYRESLGDSDYSETLAAMILEAPLDEKTQMYLKGQLSVEQLEGTPEDPRVIFGVKMEPSDKVVLLFEESLGTLGDIANLRGDLQIWPGGILYTELEATQDRVDGKGFTTNFGLKSQLGDRWVLIVESKNHAGTYENYQGNLYGLEYSHPIGLLFTIDYSRGQLMKKTQRPGDIFAGGLARSNLNLSLPLNQIAEKEMLAGDLSYVARGLSYQSRWQVVRMDQLEREIQYLLKNYLDWRLGENWTLKSDLGLVLTKNENTGEDLTRDIEGNIGLAYRPIEQDRLNLLFKYTYLDRLSPDAQSGGTEPDERGNILSLEALYDLTPKLQWGGRIAWKGSEIRDDRADGDWYASNTVFWSQRMNYLLPYNFETYLEYRSLLNTLADDQKSGFLLGLYYGIDPTTKFGVGYNFTDFSDNLTQLDYGNQGLFINMVKGW